MTSVMMTSAINERQGNLVSVVDMTVDQRNRLHGRRVATRNGYDMICRGCHGPVHLVCRGNRMFWRHNPGARAACIFGDFEPNGEGEAHFAAKLGLAKALSSLTGYTVDCERTFTDGDDTVRADVYAENENPAGEHQRPMLWEIQLSSQTHGRFIDRTEQAKRVAGRPRAWLTPHGTDLGDVRGIVTDRHAIKVTDRLYTDPYMTAPMPEMDVSAWARFVARRRPKLLWSQSGDNGEWIAYPPHANTVAPVTAEPDPATIDVPIDRECYRPPVRLLRNPNLERPSWAPADGDLCPHHMPRELDGRLYCAWCAEPLT